MKTLFKALSVGLSLLLITLSVCSCRVTLTSEEDGLYDRKNEICYYNASTVYEPTELGKEYSTVKLSGGMTVQMYVIPGVDPAVMLATQYHNLVYASDYTLPTLREMAPTAVHICMEGTTTMHVLHTISESSDIDRLVNAYADAPDMGNPGYGILRNFHIRFESPEYPGFYYALTYVEYAQDVVIDDVSYGRYFLISLFDGIYAPVDDTIHRAMGLDDAETTDTQDA